MNCCNIRLALYEIRQSSGINLTYLGSKVKQKKSILMKKPTQYIFLSCIIYVPAITLLKDTPPGTFVVRDSHSFPGAFGVAVKVAQIPSNVQPKSNDMEAELVRHFLIEGTNKGVRLKGCSNEPVFGKLIEMIILYFLI